MNRIIGDSLGWWSHAWDISAFQFMNTGRTHSFHDVSAEAIIMCIDDIATPRKIEENPLHIHWKCLQGKEKINKNIKLTKNMYKKFSKLHTKSKRNTIQKKN